MAEPLPARPSCPDCGARASARSKACAECGYAFVEDPPRAGRPRRRSLTPGAAGGADGRRFATLSLAAGVLAAATAAALLVARGGGEADDAGPERRGAAADRVRTGPEVLSRSPLSGRAAERRLEVTSSGATAEQLAELKRKTESYCTVLQTLREPPRIEVETSD